MWFSSHSNDQNIHFKERVFIFFILTVLFHFTWGTDLLTERCGSLLIQITWWNFAAADACYEAHYSKL